MFSETLTVPPSRQRTIGTAQHCVPQTVKRGTETLPSGFTGSWLLLCSLEISVCVATENCPVVHFFVLMEELITTLPGYFPISVFVPNYLTVRVTASSESSGDFTFLPLVNVTPGISTTPPPPLLYSGASARGSEAAVLSLEEHSQSTPPMLTQNGFELHNGPSC